MDHAFGSIGKGSRRLDSLEYRQNPMAQYSIYYRLLFPAQLGVATNPMAHVWLCKVGDRPRIPLIVQEPHGQLYSKLQEQSVDWTTLPPAEH